MSAPRIVITLAIVAALSWAAPGARAACHFFTVGATSSVAEGGKVTVVVERDGSIADSSVRVRTKDGTAKAPADYASVDQRVTFTGSQTSKTITVSTKQDSADEGNEAFTVEALEGEGCEINTDYGYGAPATVTITDDDAPSPTPEPTTTRRPATPTPDRTSTTTPTPSPTATSTAEPTPSPTDEPSPTTTSTVSVEEDDDAFPWAPVGLSLGTIAVVAGALVLYRLRQNVT